MSARPSPRCRLGDRAPAAGRDPRRRRQGPGLHAAGRAGAPPCARRGAHRPRRAADRGGDGAAGVPMQRRDSMEAAVALARRAVRSRATRCCCRPPARASTCSRTTRIVRRPSRTLCRRWPIDAADVRMIAGELARVRGSAHWRRSQAGSAAPRGADAMPMTAGASGRRRHDADQAAPVRVLGFDQALVWVMVALLAWGLVMVYSATIAMPDNPQLRAPTGRPSSSAPCCVAGDRLRGGAAGLPGADVLLGAARARALHRLPAAAGAGAGAAHRQGRQWRPPLDAAGLHELPALGAGQARHDALCRQLHGAQDGVKERFFRAVLPMAWRWLSSACW